MTVAQWRQLGALFVAFVLTYAMLALIVGARPGRIMTPTWYPEPLTPAELVAAVVATDVAGQVEATTWGPSWVTADDARVMRIEDRRAWR